MNYTHNGDTYKSKDGHLCCLAGPKTVLSTLPALNIDGSVTDPYLLAFSSYVHEADNRGQTVTEVGDTHFVELNPKSIDDQTKLGLLWWFLSQTGEIFNMVGFFEVASANYNDQVPAGVPNRSYIDGNEDEQVRTWAQWKDATHNHFGPWDGKYYVPGSSFGVNIKASELYAGQQGTGVTVRTLKEFKTIQDANAPETGE